MAVKRVEEPEGDSYRAPTSQQCTLPAYASFKTFEESNATANE